MIKAKKPINSSESGGGGGGGGGGETALGRSERHRTGMNSTQDQ